MGISCRVGWLRGAIFVRIKFDHVRSGPSLAHLVEPDVAQDRKQPTLLVAVRSKLSDAPKCTETSFLNQILSLGAVSGQHDGVAIEAVQIPIQVKCCFRLACFGPKT